MRNSHEIIKELVAALLLEQRRLVLPINPFTVKHKKTIQIKTLGYLFTETDFSREKYKNDPSIKDGFVLSTPENNSIHYVIFYNEKVNNIHRKKFTIAHELGHIYLEHSEQCDENEKEANAFASELLAPSCLVWELKKQSDNSFALPIQEIFGVSAAVASYKLRENFEEPTPNSAQAKLLERMLPQLPKRNKPDIMI